MLSLGIGIYSARHLYDRSDKEAKETPNECEMASNQTPSREFTHINSDSLLEDANIKDERTDTAIMSIHVQRRNVQRRQYNGEQRRYPHIK